MEKCVRKVLQETFGEAYLEPNGKNATVTESSNGRAWIYRDLSVLVAFDKETGEVWASIDVRLQPHITFLDDKTTFRYDCQLEELNREQLRWVGTAASGWETEWNVDISDIELPLDAHSAYEIGERTVYEFCRKQPAKLGDTGGGAVYLLFRALRCILRGERNFHSGAAKGGGRPPVPMGVWQLEGQIEKGAITLDK